MPLPHPSFLALHNIVDETFWWIVGTLLAIAFAAIAIYFPFLPIWLGWSTWAPLATCLSYLIWYLGKLSWDQFRGLGRLSANHGALSVEGSLSTSERRSVHVWTLYLIAVLITLSSIGMLLITAPAMLSVLGSMLALQIGVSSVIQTGLIVGLVLLSMQTVAFMIYSVLLRWSVALNPRNPAQVADRNLYYGAVMALYYIVMVVPILFIILLVGVNQTFTWAVHQLVAWMHCSFPAAMTMVGAVLLVAVPATCGVVFAFVAQCRSWYKSWKGRHAFRKRVKASLGKASNFLGITSHAPVRVRYVPGQGGEENAAEDGAVEMQWKEDSALPPESVSDQPARHGLLYDDGHGRPLSQPCVPQLPVIPAAQLSLSKELGVVYRHPERQAEMVVPVFVVKVKGVRRLFIPSFQNALDPFLSLYGSGDRVVSSPTSIRQSLEALRNHLLRYHLPKDGCRADDWGYYFNVTGVSLPDQPLIKISERAGYVLTDPSIPMDAVRGDKIKAIYTKNNLHGHLHRYVMDHAAKVFAAKCRVANQAAFSSQGSQWVAILRLMVLVEQCDKLHIASLPMLIAIDKALQSIERSSTPVTHEQVTANDHQIEVESQRSSAVSTHYNIDALHASQAKKSMATVLGHTELPSMVSQFYVASVYHLWRTLRASLPAASHDATALVERHQFLDPSADLHLSLLKHYLDQEGPAVGLWFLLTVSRRILVARGACEDDPHVIPAWEDAEKRSDDPGIHMLRCYDAPDQGSPCVMAQVFDCANRLESLLSLSQRDQPTTDHSGGVVSSLGVMKQSPGNRQPDACGKSWFRAIV